MVLNDSVPSKENHTVYRQRRTTKTGPFVRTANLPLYTALAGAKLRQHCTSSSTEHSALAPMTAHAFHCLTYPRAPDTLAVRVEKDPLSVHERETTENRSHSRATGDGCKDKSQRAFFVFVCLFFYSQIISEHDTLPLQDLEHCADLLFESPFLRFVKSASFF